MTQEALPSLVGPTAAGKTAVAIDVARRLRGRIEIEIISADSRQVYRGLDVGTAKPTPEEQAAVRHHLVDVADPRETYTAARFANEARAAIAEIRARGAVPMLVGGSGLYIRACEEGLFAGPPASEAIRERLRAQAEAEGNHSLHARLAEVDPETAKRVHPRDRVRVIRAIEVWESTGVALSEHHERHRRERVEELPPLRFALDWPVPELDARIAARTGAMLVAGWEEEVRRLLAEGVPGNAPSFAAVGYRQMLDVLEGRLSREDAHAAIVRATRQFAKRQRTWFRAVPHVRRFDVRSEDDLAMAAEAIAVALVPP